MNVSFVDYYFAKINTVIINSIFISSENTKFRPTTALLLPTIAHNDAWNARLHEKEGP